MNAIELADKLKIAQGNNNVDELIPEVIETLHQQDYEIQDLAEWKRSLMEVNSQQQAEIEAMRNRFTLAFWHDTFVEVKKPNSDLIYRFKLDETNDS